MEEPGGLQSMGSQRVGHDWAISLSFYSSFWRRKWQPTPVFLPGESHGQRGLVGWRLWGCKESDTTKQPTHTHTHITLLSGHSPALKWKVLSLNSVWLLATPWTITHQVPLSMGFPRQKYFSGVAISSSRGSPPSRDWTWVSPALQAGSLPGSHQGSSPCSETFHNTPGPTRWCPKAMQSWPLVATWWFMALDLRLNLGFRNNSFSWKMEHLFMF